MSTMHSLSFIHFCSQVQLVSSPVYSDQALLFEFLFQNTIITFLAPEVNFA